MLHLSGTSRSAIRGRRLVFLLLVLAGGCSVSPQGGEPRPGTTGAERISATEGIYTTAQADRGQRTFGTVCSVCHGRNELVGPMFEITWMVEPVGHLLQHIRTAMPQDDPGSLSPEEYAAVVAYLLRANGRPPGDRELPADPTLLENVWW